MTPMNHTIRRRAAGTVAVMLAALFAACSTAPPSESSDSAPEDAATGEPDLQAFAECMRENGIADFPDPGPDGVSLAGTGVDPESAEFQAAQAACQDLMPPRPG